MALATSTLASRIGAAASALAIGVTLAACGSSASGSSASAGGAGSAAGTAYATKQLNAATAPAGSFPPPGPAINVSKLRGSTVDFIPLGLKPPYTVVVQAELKGALAKAGITLRTCDGQLTPSVIQGCLNQAVSDGSSAVITDYIPYDLAPNAVQQLIAKGKPVFMAGSYRPASVPSKAKIAFSNPDDVEVVSTRLAADAVIQDSKGTAKALVIKLTSVPSAARAGDAAVREFKGHCQGCQVTVKDFDSTNLPQLPSEVASALLRNPGINYIIPQTETVLPGAIAGAQSAGATAKVKFATTTGTLAGLQQLNADPAMLADAGYSATYAAWTEADATMRMMLGKPLPHYGSLVRVFDRGNVKQLALTPAGQDSGSWYGSTSYQAAFLKAWGRS